jgi:hypothetical protein
LNDFGAEFPLPSPGTSSMVADSASELVGGGDGSVGLGADACFIPPSPWETFLRFVDIALEDMV